MLYYLELNFKSIPNMQHYSYTHAKFHVFDEIHYIMILLKKIQKSIFWHFYQFSP